MYTSDEVHDEMDEGLEAFCGLSPPKRIGLLPGSEESGDEGFPGWRMATGSSTSQTGGRMCEEGREALLPLADIMSWRSTLLHRINTS